MCQITPFMFLTPVRCEIPNLNFLSLVRRMTPLPSRSRSAHPLSERLHLRPQRLAELRDTGPTGTSRNYVFRTLGRCGWAPDRRLHINASWKLRARGDKDP